MVNAQKTIATAYGFKSLLPLDFSTIDKGGKLVQAFNLSKKDTPLVFVVNDNCKPCAMCGQIHTVGYASKKSGEHLLSSMISSTYNECYSLKPSNFLCEYCGYNMVSYGSPMKNPFGRKMQNAIVFESGYEEKYFNSDKDNELYDVLKNPPHTPFVILINSRGTVLENLAFTAKATISKRWIVVNYGLENLEVDPEEVFNAIEDAKSIANDAKIEITSDHIWNRQNDVGIALNSKLKNNEVFLRDVGFFVLKYNRDCRLVAKMILAAYLKNNKTIAKKTEVSAAEKATNNDATSSSLFDF